ncbi:TetR family transcriptional regulator [Rhodovibrio salinarum]|uniref:TetR/AcrR family transcriptional regulator n=1 Tax=Rhodovibrio salinarum TaxID=1087 RepID=A0A934UZU2_9PROT|nr:TetR family transcriptional regulator [Rhodovibrio salinarum]MBK1696764.1 TetR/AcrR family transcriptional regulator [Rhodovibrio salinarum]
MSSETLTPERILDAAEEVLRRYGPAKANVVDVARALGVSHGSVYRHFPTKAALRDAVASRWLARVSAPLRAIAEADGPATERLQRWLRALAEAKRHKVRDDPELFATYHAIAEESREVVRAHVDELVGDLARIVADGQREGVFHVRDAEAAARGVFDATQRFHHPAHSDEWADPDIDRAYDSVVALLLAGLRAGPDGPDSRV